MIRKVVGLLVVLLAGGAFATTPPATEVATNDNLRPSVEDRRDRVEHRRLDGSLEAVTFTWPEAGSWKEIFLRYEPHGAPVIRHFEVAGKGTTNLAAQLKDLGLALGVTPAPTQSSWEEVARGRRWTTENSFARVESFRPADSWEQPGPDGRVWMRQHTEVMGTSLTVTRFKYPGYRYEVTDDFGGWRTETYSNHRLVAAADSHGSLVSIRRDSRGRIHRALLVNRYEVRYDYFGESPDWNRKTVVDLTTGRTLVRVTAQDTPKRIDLLDHDSSVPPHPRTMAYLSGDSGGGPIVAEWDSRSVPGGTAIATLDNQPYALLPFEGGPPSARVLQFFHREPPFFHGSASFFLERLDYTETRARLWLQSDQENGLNEARTIVLELTRQAQPPPENGWQDSPEDGGFPYLPGSNGSGSSGGGSGSPTYGNPLTPDMQFEVNHATSTALDRLRDIPSCGALFADLNRTDGVWVIQNTEYRQWQENTRCQTGGVAAFTTLNRLEVYLCDRFASLSSSTQAATLIHEALHSAGLEEAPTYPDAMTSSEIQAMVNAQCGF